MNKCMPLNLVPTKNDEINLINAGSNYGWPEVQCYSNNDNFCKSSGMF